MFSSKNFFSVYDFLGYLIPGLIFCLGISFALLDPTEIKSFFNVYKDLDLNFNSSVAAVVLIYLLGHILSYVSAMTIEKYSRWTLDFPSKYLFNKANAGLFDSAKKLYNSKKESKKGRKRRLIFRYIIISLMFIFLLPFSIFDVIIRCIIKLENQYSRPFGEGCLPFIQREANNFIKEISKITGEKLPDGINCEDSDYFRILSHYVKENAPNHAESIRNYVTLYGFCRTTTLILVITTWTTLLVYVIKGFYWWYLLYPLGLSVLSFIMYMEFNKFYRKYSVEVFLAFCTVYKKK